jgi:hypothetical protein
MRLLGLVNRIPIKTYAAANPECQGCLRFLKADLTAKSRTFRFLNRFVEPAFKSVRDPRLIKEEVEEAKVKAELMMKTLISEASEDLESSKDSETSIKDPASKG